MSKHKMENTEETPTEGVITIPQEIKDNMIFQQLVEISGIQGKVFTALCDQIFDLSERVKKLENNK